MRLSNFDLRLTFFLCIVLFYLLLGRLKLDLDLEIFKYDVF